jgi:chromosome segregation protein
MKLTFIEMCGFRGFREKVRVEIPKGFLVVTGRNGSGKSTLLDAIDYVFTGTLNKFDVKGAKGGGLEEHIWWVGAGDATGHYVTIGLADDRGYETSFTRSRENGPDFKLSELADVLSVADQHSDDWPRVLMQTSLLRDETISSLSLDQAEQARATAVQSAIGGLTGKDNSKRTTAILNAAKAVRDVAESRSVSLQQDLSRALSAVTEARSLAERSQDLAKAEITLRQLEPLVQQSPRYAADIRERIQVRRNAISQLSNALEIRDAFLGIKLDETETVVSVQSEVESLIAEVGDLDIAHTTALVEAANAEEGDSFAADMLSLLRHGLSVGLIEGRCPLCDAARSTEQFEEAIAKAKTKLEQRAVVIDSANRNLSKVADKAEAARARLSSRQGVLEVMKARHARIAELNENLRSYRAHAAALLSNIEKGEAEDVLLRSQEEIARLVSAFETHETSSLTDLVSTAEQRLDSIKKQVETEAIRLYSAERALETAKQIDAAAKLINTQILNERFDTVLPLLKEFYRRLRPHIEWREIETDFGGKVKASLNFSVGDGCNPQFLFSSGQRRAAGLAFLLAIHLSRPWCKWQTLLLDDPVQHIDDYRALNLVEVLSAIRKTSRQVVVIVENEALADVLSRRLRAIETEPGAIVRMAMTPDGAAGIEEMRFIGALSASVLKIA